MKICLPLRHACGMDFNLLQYYWSTLRMISYYKHYKVWDEITHSFPNFNGAAGTLGHGYVILYHTFLGMCLLIHDGIKVKLG